MMGEIWFEYIYKCFMFWLKCAVSGQRIIDPFSLQPG